MTTNVAGEKDGVLQSIRQKRESVGFDLPISVEDAERALRSYYAHCVRQRLDEFVETRQMASNMKRIAEFLVNERRKFGLFINGDCGNGKTTMARSIAALINCLIDAGRLSAVECSGYRYALRINAMDFVKAYPNDGGFNSIKNRKYLIIDDLGEEPADLMIYGATFYPFAEILNYRYEYMLPTVICSNLSADDIKEKYGRRMADRLRESFMVLAFKDKSFR